MSVLLIAMQALVVDAWCILCLVSTAVSLLNFGNGIDEPLDGPRHLRRVRARGSSAWRAFRGLEAGKWRDGHG